LNYAPLHYAARNGGSEMVRLLLDYEAGLDCSGRRTLFDVAYAAKRDDTLWVLIEYGITERREALEELPTIDADSLPDWAFDKVQVNICHRPRRSVGGRSDLQRAVPGSTLEALLGLPNRAVAEEEEEDLGLAGLFWLPPDPEDVLPPAASAPEPRRSKRVLSVAGYYAALAGVSSRKARK
jgi:hypothetical protein